MKKILKPKFDLVLVPCSFIIHHNCITKCINYIVFNNPSQEIVDWVCKSSRVHYIISSLQWWLHMCIINTKHFYSQKLILSTSQLNSKVKSYSFSFLRISSLCVG